jgi:hypothetical protein
MVAGDPLAGQLLRAVQRRTAGGVPPADLASDVGARIRALPGAPFSVPAARGPQRGGATPIGSPLVSTLEAAPTKREASDVAVTAALVEAPPPRRLNSPIVQRAVVLHEDDLQYPTEPAASAAWQKIKTKLFQSVLVSIAQAKGVIGECVPPRSGFVITYADVPSLPQNKYFEHPQTVALHEPIIQVPGAAPPPPTPQASLWHDDDPRQLATLFSKQGTVYTSNADQSEWVMDGLGQKLPRYVWRNISDDDAAQLKSQKSIVSRSRGGPGTDDPRDHVSGRAESKLISTTKIENGVVVNAQGEKFLGSNGTVKIDLGAIHTIDIYDMSTDRAALQLLLLRRADANLLLERAKTLHAEGQINWSEPAVPRPTKKPQELTKKKQNRRTAIDKKKEHATEVRGADAKDSQLKQALLDVRRTGEVLIRGSIPHTAVQRL